MKICITLCLLALTVAAPSWLSNYKEMLVNQCESDYKKFSDLDKYMILNMCETYTHDCDTTVPYHKNREAEYANDFGDCMKDSCDYAKTVLTDNSINCDVMNWYDFVPKNDLPEGFTEAMAVKGNGLGRKH